MTSSDHSKPIAPIPPDVQEFESTKYLYRPLLFAKLRSGNIAVASGLGARQLQEIIDPATPEGRERFFAILLSAATLRTKSGAEEYLERQRLRDEGRSLLDSIGDLEL